jgi:hypothetical protein
VLHLRGSRGNTRSECIIQQMSHEDYVIHRNPNHPEERPPILVDKSVIYSDDGKMVFEIFLPPMDGALSRIPTFCPCEK